MQLVLYSIYEFKEKVIFVFWALKENVASILLNSGRKSHLLNKTWSGSAVYFLQLLM